MSFLKTPLRQSSRGFTLIELLVVITVIAILAGLVLQTAGYVQKKAGRSRAEAEIAALSAALDSYKADMGDYPVANNLNPKPGTNSDSGTNKFLRVALAPNGVNSLNSLNKVYFEFSKGMGTNTTISMDTDQNVLDPFGYLYCYQYPGSSTRSGTNFFDLWSTAGTTAASQSNQWIKNW